MFVLEELVDGVDKDEERLVVLDDVIDEDVEGLVVLDEDVDRVV